MKPLIAVVVILGAWALAQPVGAAEDCGVTLEIMGKEVWTVKVTEAGISGDDNALRFEDGVIFGFVGGKQVRLRFQEEGSQNSGSIGGGVLHYAKGEGTLSVNGFTDRARFKVNVSSNGLVLGSEKILLRLARQKDPDPAGRVSLLDDTGHVRLRFAACAWAQMATRPELGILLQNTVLQRVAELEDLSKGAHSAAGGRSTRPPEIETTTRTSTPPTPPPSSNVSRPPPTHR
jgi:hypothetical protein